ncbi:MAG: hypothetical protein WC209_14570 [Ignavibacteriaceae bacterium]
MSIISNEINRQLTIKASLPGIKVVTKSSQSRYKVVLKSLKAFAQLSENVLLLNLGFGWLSIPIRAPAQVVLSGQSAAANQNFAYCKLVSVLCALCGETVSGFNLLCSFIFY